MLSLKTGSLFRRLQDDPTKNLFLDQRNDDEACAFTMAAFDMKSGLPAIYRIADKSFALIHINGDVAERIQRRLPDSSFGSGNRNRRGYSRLASFNTCIRIVLVQ